MVLESNPVEQAIVEALLAGRVVTVFSLVEAAGVGLGDARNILHKIHKAREEGITCLYTSTMHTSCSHELSLSAHGGDDLFGIMQTGVKFDDERNYLPLSIRSNRPVCPPPPTTAAQLAEPAKPAEPEEVAVKVVDKKHASQKSILSFFTKK